MSARVPPRASKWTSSPPEPSTRTIEWVRAISLMVRTWSPTVGMVTPARRAATSGASGSGRRTSSRVGTAPPGSALVKCSTTAASPSSSESTPVWATLTTVTSVPRARRAHAIAAVAIVLPTSVLVPVMRTTFGRESVIGGPTP